MYTRTKTENVTADYSIPNETFWLDTIETIREVEGEWYLEIEDMLTHTRYYPEGRGIEAQRTDCVSRIEHPITEGDAKKILRDAGLARNKGWRVR